MDHLAAGLAHRRQADEFALGRKARLLQGLALGCQKLVLAVVDLALGDRPGAVVLACPVGAAGMHQEERQRRRAPEDHQAGAVVTLGHYQASGEVTAPIAAPPTPPTITPGTMPTPVVAPTTAPAPAPIAPPVTARSPGEGPQAERPRAR